MFAVIVDYVPTIACPIGTDAYYPSVVLAPLFHQCAVAVGVAGACVRTSGHLLLYLCNPRVVALLLVALVGGATGKATPLASGAHFLNSRTWW